MSSFRAPKASDHESNTAFTLAADSLIASPNFLSRTSFRTEVTFLPILRFYTLWKIIIEMRSIHSLYIILFYQ